jgi:hypothetical protein
VSAHTCNCLAQDEELICKPLAFAHKETEKRMDECIRNVRAFRRVGASHESHQATNAKHCKVSVESSNSLGSDIPSGCFERCLICTNEGLTGLR